MDGGFEMKFSFKDSTYRIFSKINGRQKLSSFSTSVLFILMALQCVRLINQYYAVPNEQWRVVLAFACFILSSILILLPILAAWILKRSSINQKKGQLE